MNRIYGFGIALLVVAAMVSVIPNGIPEVSAHHSAVEFDTGKVVELTGTVKEFQFKNPHTWLQVMVPNAKGESVEWSLEWGSPNTLGRQGYRPTSFPVGAKVTVRVNPLKSGAAGGAFIGARFEDGKTIGNWN